MKYNRIKLLKWCICLVTLLVFYWNIRQTEKGSTPLSLEYLKKFSEATSKYTNIDALELIYCSNVCIYKKPKIVILVTSHVLNVDARNIIRKSYPQDMFKKLNTQLVFLLAVPSNNSFDRRRIENEFRTHEDLVQGRFIEAYRNLTFKHLMGLRWVREFCNTAAYVIKVDDDIVVNYYKLFEILNKFKKRFDILGHVIDGMKPIRDVANKWCVTEKEFQREEYPTFVSGWMYMMTAKAADVILEVSHQVPFFWIDDVFVSGILREKGNLTVTDISQHFRYEPKNVECCIKNKYSCGFLAAPNGKNFKLNLHLNNHLWECRYKRICILESNIRRSCWSSINSYPMKGKWTVQKLE